MIGSSSGSVAVIDSSLGLSVLFFRHVASFLSDRATIFFNQKQIFCFTFIVFSETISITCFRNFNKTDSKKHEDILAR